MEAEAVKVLEEPEIKSVTIDVCVLCLAGFGGECHSPGCVFFICPAPTFEQAQRLAYAEEPKCYVLGPMSPSENQRDA